MSLERKIKWGFVLVACAAIAAVSVWFVGAGNASQENTPAKAGTGVSPRDASRAKLPTPVACTATNSLLRGASIMPPVLRSTGLATTWSFASALDNNYLPVQTVDNVPSGVLIDATSGNALWAKNHHQPREIASMTKMMTVLLAMESMQQGHASLDQTVTVTRTAAEVGGSQVYLKQGEMFTLGELLKTVLIKSANDSAELVAETLSGSIDAFVLRMNQRARELGMRQTKFYNVHGLPEAKSNTSTALDMALLARELLKHPLVLQWSSTQADTFRNGQFALNNSNPLLGHVRGVDGLKTGYYSHAGFCITFTVQRNGVRLIGVAIGIKNKSVRTTFCQDLIEWGYRQVQLSSAQVNN